MTEAPKKRGRPRKPLSPREIQFARHVIAGKNATQAALAAGYATTTAEKKGHALLSRPGIRDEIEAARGEIRKKARYELEDAVRDVDNLITEAREAKQFTAAATLFTVKAKLFGLLIERQAHLHESVDLSQALKAANERSRLPMRDITPGQPVLALSHAPDIFN